MSLFVEVVVHTRSGASLHSPLMIRAQITGRLPPPVLRPPAACRLFSLAHAFCLLPLASYDPAARRRLIITIDGLCNVYMLITAYQNVATYPGPGRVLVLSSLLCSIALSNFCPMQSSRALQSDTCFSAENLRILYQLEF